MGLACGDPPIRLTGTIAAVDRNTGRITGQLHTDELPDRMLYKACGNCRESACPDCTWVYQGDAYQVVCRGLTGGKGVTASVDRHPVVFATFTTPSFGPVHHRRLAPHLPQPATLRLPPRALPRPQQRRHVRARTWRRTEIERRLAPRCRQRGIPKVGCATHSKTLV